MKPENLEEEGQKDPDIGSTWGSAQWRADERIWLVWLRVQNDKKEAKKA